MHMRWTKAAFTGLWMVAVTVITVTGTLASGFSWMLVAVLATIPPAVFCYLWNPPVSGMPEEILKARRD